jgi:hypothetical protein
MCRFGICGTYLQIAYLLLSPVFTPKAFFIIKDLQDPAAQEMHMARNIQQLLDGVLHWGKKENEDWDGHPKSYDIVALLSMNPAVKQGTVSPCPASLSY